MFCLRWFEEWGHGMRNRGSVKMRGMLVFLLLMLIMPLSGAAAELERGSRGDEVKRLQQMLIDTGFLHDAADGVFGKKTQAAVEAYQLYCGMEKNGVADEGVLNDLEILWQMVMGIESEPGAPVDDADYPPFCSLTPDGSWHAEYCARHIRQYPAAIQLSASNPPDELERLLAERIASFWYESICTMYAEWAGWLGHAEGNAAGEQRDIFLAALDENTAMWNEQAAPGSNDAALDRMMWLDSVGVKLCFDLYGAEETP